MVMERAVKGEGNRTRRGIQSIEIGATVLRVLAAASGPLQLKDIGAATGMPPSKVYKYLISFIAAGLVKQEAASGRYDLGSFAIELGLAGLGRIDELDTVGAALVRITTELEHDAQISVWTERGPTIVRWRQGSKGVALRVREGSVLPLLNTATGRLWTCHLPSAATEGLIASELEHLAANSDQPRAVLWEYYEEKIASIRRYGLARAEGERRPGIDALAGPIFNRDGIAFAITLLGPHNDFELSFGGPVAKSFAAILRETSRQLGGTADGASV
jgi:DNA-binding IclR family transcriptional regulator